MRSFFAYDGPMMYGLGGLSEYSMKGTKSEGPSKRFFLTQMTNSLKFLRKLRLPTRCRLELKQVRSDGFIPPVILHIPHASTLIPDWVKDRFLLDEEGLEQEQLKMVDLYADELFGHKGYPAIISPVSRLVCDVERFSDDEKEPMALVGMGMMYEKTHDGKQLRRAAYNGDKEELLRRYHRQNELEVESAVTSAIGANGIALIIDCHTFPSVPHPFERDQAYPRPDICIGTDSIHTPADLLQLIKSYFIGLGYSVAINSPYQGTYVPSRLYRRNRSCMSIMIEISRSLYINEATGERLSGFPMLQTRLALLLERVEVFLMGISHGREGP